MGSNVGQKRLRSTRIQDSFLEALRELSSGSSKASYPDFDNLVRSPRPQAGELVPGQAAEINAAAEGEKYKRLFFHERSLHQEERVLRVRQEQETKVRIQAIREELKKFSSAHVKLEEQVKVAVLQTEVTPTPGKYHISFFEQLLSFIMSLRKNVESASSWLASFNQKSKKRNYYWGQVKKSGSKFYLSADRYMATQAG